MNPGSTVAVYLIDLAIVVDLSEEIPEANLIVDLTDLSFDLLAWLNQAVSQALVIPPPMEVCERLFHGSAKGFVSEED